MNPAKHILQHLPATGGLV
uniref:Uncharacterized protein n=1 Tax=Arundo donax TaxID=35708 RepID=A0A0A9HPG8_ARUDO